MVATRIESILSLRSRSQQFLIGALAFDELVRALRWYSFDDEDEKGRWDPRLVVKDLPDELQTEYLFYVKWRGLIGQGIPKSTGWVYGQSAESYGWIDKAAFKKQFTEEFHKLTLLLTAEGCR